MMTPNLATAPAPTRDRYELACIMHEVKYTDMIRCSAKAKRVMS